ncbi:MAG: acylphosphatase [Betaproteobacteria bacterium]|nr:acylphosphatase [Betaproteobacteria bacterium]MDH5221023.1 acylphosphatase [Betaproteobacteria bacterium]MDH5350298.1 acylphosphatase [Betaproteobacteria bacterium]
MHLRIRGLVQGVGYRDALCREAARLGVTGWVRNCSNGDVEALAQGSDAALDALHSWARRGPPAARVEQVERGPGPQEHLRNYARFERWPTV